jgi:ribonuclease Z
MRNRALRESGLQNIGMKILFLGTGDAFSHRANTSILIDEMILLDCGLTTVQQLMKANADLHKISAVSISHFHMDHAFGIPALLSVCKKEGRTRPLIIYGPAGAEKYVKELLVVAHKKGLDVFGFEINVQDSNDSSIDGYSLAFAPMKHSLPCNAISIVKDGKKITYTGDGKPTPEAKEIMQNSDILIAEAYKAGYDHHHSIADAAKLAKETNARKLAVIHISRKENIKEELVKAKRIFTQIIVPEDLSTRSI